MKKILSCILIFAMAFALAQPVTIALAAPTESPSGGCGENLTWMADLETGVLTIRGTGEMSHYVIDSAPWAPYKEKIKTVVIEPGVTTIGEAAFENCTGITSVSLPDTLTDIHAVSFRGCSNLTQIFIPASVTFIAHSTFGNCTALKKLYFAGDVPTFNDGIIYEDTVATVYYPLGNKTWTEEVLQSYIFQSFTCKAWIPPFLDVDAERFYGPAVAWAVNDGITSGMSETSFAPNGSCTRGQVITFLWRAAGKPEPAGTENPFTDVSSDRFYYKAILWAAEQGIANGLTDTTFGPEKTVTRGQFVTFLWRAAGKPEATGGENPFADVTEERFFYEAVLWAAEKGVTSGMTETTFVPDDFCTRGQVVTFLFRNYGK